MGVRRLGIVMNGVTGRMGTNQHLIRSIVAIRAEGGVRLANGDRVMPDPILVGRSEEKLAALAKAHGVARTTTNLDAALADKNDTVFFDAATTQMRPALLAKAIAAGKHIYCEKPVATNLEEALGIVRKAKAAGIKHGVVQDKLFLPGLRKLKMLIDSGLLRPHPGGARRVRLLGVRGRPAAGPAPLLELSRRGRRRHDPRHALPLALRARQHLRQRQVGLLPRRHAYPRARRRGGQALQGHRRRCRLRHLPARRRHHRPLQLLVGHARAPRRPSHAARRRHARLRGRRPAGRGGAAAHGHAQAGLEPRRQAGRSTSTPAGSRCPTRKPTTTASSCSGKPSSAMSARAPPTSGTSRRAPRACSSSSARCGPGRSAAGSTSRS